jgi:[acyl-carrier-protein] S-malonyltransferase
VIFNGPADRLTLTENTQPAILTMSVAVWRLLESRGLSPSFVAGHSLGEYSAHVAAGTLAFQDAVRLVRNRGRYMQEAVPVGQGAMAAILGLDETGVIKACEEAAHGEVVSPANLNAPGQIVIAGSAAAVARASERAKALGAKRAIPLQVSAPFHCALMTPAAHRLAPELRAAPARDPRVPVVANVDAEPKRTAPASIEALIKQIASPVRWENVVQRLASEGVTRYVEVGPGKVLTGLAKKIAPGATLLNVEGPEDLPAIEALFSAA